MAALVGCGEKNHLRADGRQIKIYSISSWKLCTKVCSALKEMRDNKETIVLHALLQRSRCETWAEIPGILTSNLVVQRGGACQFDAAHCPKDFGTGHQDQSSRAD